MIDSGYYLQAPSPQLVQAFLWRWLHDHLQVPLDSARVKVEKFFKEGCPGALAYPSSGVSTVFRHLAALLSHGSLLGLPYMSPVPHQVVAVCTRADLEDVNYGNHIGSIISSQHGFQCVKDVIDMMTFFIGYGGFIIVTRHGLLTIAYIVGVDPQSLQNTIIHWPHEPLHLQ